MLKYLDCEFYSIEKHENQKKIHIFGYVYYADGNQPYRALEYTGFMVPLVDFLNKDFDYVSEQSNYGTHIGDLSETEAEKCMNTYFNGHDSGKEKPFTELTMQTPCGNYVNYDRRGKMSDSMKFADNGVMQPLLRPAT